MSGGHRPPDDRRCQARSKSRGGARCGNWAVTGSRVCRIHGGSAGQVRRAAARRLEVEQVEADVNATLAHAGIAPIDDPILELGRLAAEAVAFKDALAARVNSLRQVRYSAPGSGAEQLRAEVQLLERAEDRAGRLLALLVSSGFREREVRVSEQQGALVALAMKRILERLGLDPREPSVAGVVVEELTRLESATVPGRVLP